MARESTEPAAAEAKPNQRNLVDLLVRIPLFQDLVPAECKKILAVCHQASFAADEVIYAAGTPGNQMLILLRGAVKILSPHGTVIAQVKALDTVGEVEIGTSLSRMATVAAHNEVSGLTLSKGGLEGIIQSDPVLGVKVLRNVLNNVARKLASADSALDVLIARAASRRPAAPGSLKKEEGESGA